MTAQKNLYETDYYGWCLGQAKILRENNGLDLPFDFENLAEEITSLGDSEKTQLVKALTLMFMHILKWKYQPARQSNSWRNTVNHRRIKVKRILKKSPSLAPHLQECIEEAYEDARYDASEETYLDLEVFPKEMPFSYEDAMKEGWMP